MTQYWRTVIAVRKRTNEKYFGCSFTYIVGSEK